MPQFVFLLKADQSGSIGMLAAGREGEERCRKAIASLGGELHQYLPVTGAYDVVILAGLPTDVATLVLSHAFNVAGMYAEALRAFSPEEVAEAAPVLQQLLDIVRTQDEDADVHPAEDR